MGSNDGEGLVSQLHKLGARTIESTELSEEEACAAYEMTPKFFEPWPAYFAQVEKSSPGVTPYVRFVPLNPDPDPVGLLFPQGDPPTTRPSAVVLRGPLAT